MKTLIAFTTLFILFSSCESNSPKSQIDSLNNTLKRTDSILKADEKEQEQWKYDQDTDKMTSKVTFTAASTSINDLSLQPPYDGDNKGYIVIRKRRSVTDAYIKIDKGQFITGVYSTQIRVRFDKRKALSFSCERSSDDNPTVLFIEHASTFIADLKRSKHTIIEATLFEAGDQQLEFNTENLKWSH